MTAAERRLREVELKTFNSFPSFQEEEGKAYAFRNPIGASKKVNYIGRWEIRKDEMNGQKFYYHTGTHESSWSKPEGFEG